jgi:hypothetical protein
MRRLERMKLGNGIKDRDDKSSGIEILMTESFVKNNPSFVLFIMNQESES